ncbi:MAG: hypothetical protein K9M45_04235 [Kiritimatiellales bacterium]|nr:hypothetical protein [Kiritimatiellales bacterium]
MKIYKSDNFAFHAKKNAAGHVVLAYDAIGGGILAIAVGIYFASMGILILPSIACAFSELREAISESLMYFPMLFVLLAFYGLLTIVPMFAIVFGVKNAISAQKVIFDRENQKANIKEQVFIKTKSSEFPLADVSFAVHVTPLPKKSPPQNGYALSIVAGGRCWMIARNALKKDVVALSRQCRSQGINVQITDHTNKPADSLEIHDQFGQSQKASNIADDNQVAKVRLIREAVLWSFLAIFSLSITIFVVFAALSPRRIGKETGKIDFIGILMLPLILTLGCTKRAIHSVREAWKFGRSTPPWR